MGRLMFFPGPLVFPRFPSRHFALPRLNIPACGGTKVRGKDGAKHGGGAAAFAGKAAAEMDVCDRVFVAGDLASPGRLVTAWSISAHHSLKPLISS
jgi:hypothetical protein